MTLPNPCTYLDLAFSEYQQVQLPNGRCVGVHPADRPASPTFAHPLYEFQPDGLFHQVDEPHLQFYRAELNRLTGARVHETLWEARNQIKPFSNR